MEPIVRECPAKLNLFLRVLAREADGYHGIETLFCRVALSDTLTVARSSTGVALEVEGADLGRPEDNLAWRAADAILEATGRSFGVRMHLVKRIPHGAGMGGGSSDAAGALLATNALIGDAVPRGELYRIATTLGADVPFFLGDSPLALAWGRGQRLLALPAPPPAPVLLLFPEIRVRTGEAYGWLDRRLEAGGARAGIQLQLASLDNWGDLGRLGGNDFESVVFGRFPAIHAAFEALAETGPLLCRMTGSGSALFAVYRTVRDRDDASRQLGDRYGHRVATTTT